MQQQTKDKEENLLPSEDKLVLDDSKPGLLGGGWLGSLLGGAIGGGFGSIFNQAGSGATLGAGVGAFLPFKKGGRVQSSVNVARPIKVGPYYPDIVLLNKGGRVRKNKKGFCKNKKC